MRVVERYKVASCKTRGRVVKQRRDNDRREIKLWTKAQRP